MKAKTLLWLLHALLTFSIARANETEAVQQAQAWRKEMQVAQKSAYHSVRWQKVGSLVMGASEIKVFNKLNLKQVAKETALFCKILQLYVQNHVDLFHPAHKDKFSVAKIKAHLIAAQHTTAVKIAAKKVALGNSQEAVDAWLVQEAKGYFEPIETGSQAPKNMCRDLTRRLRTLLWTIRAGVGLKSGRPESNYLDKLFMAQTQALESFGNSTSLFKSQYMAKYNSALTAQPTWPKYPTMKHFRKALEANVGPDQLYHQVNSGARPTFGNPLDYSPCDADPSLEGCPVPAPARTLADSGQASTQTSGNGRKKRNISATQRNGTERPTSAVLTPPNWRPWFRDVVQPPEPDRFGLSVRPDVGTGKFTLSLPTSGPYRVKRAVFAILAALATLLMAGATCASTVMSVSNAAKLNYLQTEMARDQQSLQNLVILSGQIDNNTLTEQQRIDLLGDTIMAMVEPDISSRVQSEKIFTNFETGATILNSGYSLIAEQLRRYENAYPQIRKHSVPFGLFSPEDMEKIYETASVQADNVGQTLFAKNAASLLTYHSNTLIKNGEPYITVDLPAYDANSMTLDLLRYDHRPVHFNNFSFTLDMPNPYIAMTRDRMMFVELSEKEFQDCVYTGSRSTYYCPRLAQVLSKNYKTSCSAQLLRRDHAELDEHCPIYVSHREQGLTRIAERKFESFSNDDVAIDVLCGGSREVDHTLHCKGLCVLDIPAGCQADSPFARAFSNQDFILSKSLRFQEVDFRPEEILIKHEIAHKLNTDRLHDAITKFAKAPKMTHVSFTALKQTLTSPPVWTAEGFNHHKAELYLVIPLLMAAIFGALMGVRWCRRYTHNRKIAKMVLADSQQAEQKALLEGGLSIIRPPGGALTEATMAFRR